MIYKHSIGTWPCFRPPYSRSGNKVLWQSRGSGDVIDLLVTEVPRFVAEEPARCSCSSLKTAPSRFTELWRGVWSVFKGISAAVRVLYIFHRPRFKARVWNDNLCAGVIDLLFLNSNSPLGFAFKCYFPPRVRVSCVSVYSTEAASASHIRRVLVPLCPAYACVSSDFRWSESKYMRLCVSACALQVCKSLYLTVFDLFLSPKRKKKKTELYVRTIKRLARSALIKITLGERARAYLKQHVNQFIQETFKLITSVMEAWVSASLNDDALLGYCCCRPAAASHQVWTL